MRREKKAPLSPIKRGYSGGGAGLLWGGGGGGGGGGEEERKKDRKKKKPKHQKARGPFARAKVLKDKVETVQLVVLVFSFHQPFLLSLPIANRMRSIAKICQL